MKKKNPAALMKRLIENQITKEELERLLDGIDDEETTKIYGAYLQNHFDQIMNEYVLKEGKKENQ